MRLLAFLTLLFVCFTTVVPAQRMMRNYRMAYSLSGFYSTGSSETNIAQYSGSGTFGSNVDRETFRLATRDGYFFTRNLLVGIELGWEQTSSEARPDPNPSGARLESFERRLFIGPLLRWYQPMNVRWFLYPELSFGYSHSLDELEESDVNSGSFPTSTDARGFALHAGVGVGYFLTRYVVFDASVRYMRAWRDGIYEIPTLPDRDVDMNEYDVQLLVGFQLLI
ncbi:MAG: outer membrane beta-barrel protein [Bacteroidetes bacterium]|nr:outer membrane beta-barrel protein [Bacteroidota bacterium]